MITAQSDPRASTADSSFLIAAPAASLTFCTATISNSEIFFVKTAMTSGFPALALSSTWMLKEFMVVVSFKFSAAIASPLKRIKVGGHK